MAAPIKPEVRIEGKKDEKITFKIMGGIEDNPIITLTETGLVVSGNVADEFRGKKRTFQHELKQYTSTTHVEDVARREVRRRINEQGETFGTVFLKMDRRS